MIGRGCAIFLEECAPLSKGVKIAPIVRNILAGRLSKFVEVLTKAANFVQFVGVNEAGYSVLSRWLGMTAVVGFTLSLLKQLRSLATAALGLAILKGAAASRHACRRQADAPGIAVP